MDATQVRPEFKSCLSQGWGPGQVTSLSEPQFPHHHTEILILTRQRCREEEEVNTWETAAQMAFIQ